MECQLKIRTPDKHIIHGVLNRAKSKSKGLVIFVHGLGGTDYWPPLLEASRYFNKRGYSTIRFNLYGWMKGARKFVETSLTEHAEDLNTVVNYAKRLGFKRIFAVGHSFGGLTVIRGDTSCFCAVSVWDMSSLIKHPPLSWFRYDKKRKCYLVPGQVDFIIGDKYISDLKTFPSELGLISTLSCPFQICYAAGKSGVLKDSSKRYFKYAQTEKELIAIPNASHCFIEEGTDSLLFDATAKWFAKFKRSDARE